MKLYQVDAFTRRRFHGNPAAVVPMEVFPEDTKLQAIAAENNLSETAYFTPVSGRPGSFNLRWFTPTVEVDLCGHATLASAHVLWSELGFAGDQIAFHSRSGELRVARDSDRYVLDLPEKLGERVEVSNDVIRALGREPAEVYVDSYTMCIFENKRDVHEVEPDMRAIAGLDAHGVIVTAPGAGHDFVSRFFAPALGVPEDPVTGSAHCALVPYWSRRLGKKELTAHQVSHRGGELWCRWDDAAHRVHLGGHAVTYLRGEISIND
jgi:PhzF family phenazine biosynthesis protein